MKKTIAVYEITTTTRVVVSEFLIPSPPVVHSITFAKGIGPNVAQRTGTITLSSPVDPTVTSIPMTIVGSSVAGQNPITIDLFLTPAPTFQANDGDILGITGVQINPTGTSTVSASVEIVVAAGTVLPGPPVGVVPVPPSVASVNFV